MNILIVGNGFDLSHYLPTKYEHFMGVMKNIENWSNHDEHMYFDDLFDKENGFFQKTKSMYQAEKICISNSDIKNLKDKLKINVWYKFFSHHLHQIDTWIDFELEFSKALDLVALFTERAEETYKIHEKLEDLVQCRNFVEGAKYLGFKHKTIDKLSLLGILLPLQSGGISHGAKINRKFYRNQKIDLDLDFDLIIRDLEFYLNDFIYLFNLYLKEVIKKLEPKNRFDQSNFKFSSNDLLIMSFNYTSTFSSFYSEEAKVEYVHGVVGKDLVLGIPDVKNEFLKKFKNYSFTKYHQKLLKGTDYLFLHENPMIKAMFKTRTVGLREINIYIWGHSLAESDESYIKEIFSLNNDDSVVCRVVVYFYENDAPQLLNNLLDILGKDLVEQWMKKGWLKFEKNPEISLSGETTDELIEEAS